MPLQVLNILKGKHKMNELTIELLQKLCNNNSVLWTAHALRRLQERSIYREDVFNAISTGKIIEQYPDSYPHPACLVLGMSLNNEHLHIVVGCDGDVATIITAYFPTPDKFKSDLETRKGE